MSPVQLSESQVQAIGEALKSAREKRGDNVAEAAFKIALSPSQLRAIEIGDLRPFYSPKYFMQAAQRYANLLGVDLPAPPANPEPTPEPQLDLEAEPAPSTTPLITPSAAVPAAIQKAEASVEPELDAEPTSETSSSQRRPGGLRWGWIALAAAVLITLGILKISLGQSPKQEPVIAAATPPVTPAAEDHKPAEVATAPTGLATPQQPVVAKSAPTTVAAPAAVTSASAPMTPATLSTNTRLPQSPSSVSDGQLIMQTSTWVQIVKNNGEKINLKTEPGQKVEFPSADTAAVVFGQPEKANLTIQGKAVNLAPFITQDSPPRALVILNRINQ